MKKELGFKPLILKKWSNNRQLLNNSGTKIDRFIPFKLFFQNRDV